MAIPMRSPAVVTASMSFPQIISVKTSHALSAVSRPMSLSHTSKAGLGRRSSVGALRLIYVDELGLHS
eukprot:5317720-Prymnesium_polylepis.1